MSCLRFSLGSQTFKHKFQHQTGIDYVDQMVVRCPNWERGCDYCTSRLRPVEGKIRFLNELDSVVHCPETEESASKTSLTDQPPWVIQKVSYHKEEPSSPDSQISAWVVSLFSFLGFEGPPGNSLRCHRRTAIGRSQMEKDYRWMDQRWLGKHLNTVFLTFIQRYVFSTGDQPVKMKWEPAGGMCTHLSVCQFGQKKEYSEQRVLVLPV